MACLVKNQTRPFSKPTTMTPSILLRHSQVWMLLALCIGGLAFRVEMSCTLLLWISASRLPLCNVQLFLGRRDPWHSRTGSQHFWIIALMMPLVPISSQKGSVLLQTPWRKLKQGHQTWCSPAFMLMNMCEAHTTAVRDGKTPSLLRRSFSCYHSKVRQWYTVFRQLHSWWLFREMIPLSLRHRNWPLMAKQGNRSRCFTLMGRAILTFTLEPGSKRTLRRNLNSWRNTSAYPTMSDKRACYTISQLADVFAFYAWYAEYKDRYNHQDWCISTLCTSALYINKFTCINLGISLRFSLRRKE